MMEAKDSLFSFTNNSKQSKKKITRLTTKIKPIITSQEISTVYQHFRQSADERFQCKGEEASKSADK